MHTSIVFQLDILLEKLVNQPVLLDFYIVLLIVGLIRPSPSPPWPPPKIRQLASLLTHAVGGISIAKRLAKKEATSVVHAIEIVQQEFLRSGVCVTAYRFNMSISLMEVQ